MPDFRHALILQHLQELQIGHPPPGSYSVSNNTTYQFTFTLNIIKRFSKGIKQNNTNKTITKDEIDRRY